MKFKIIEDYGMYDYEEISLTPGLYYLVTANGNGKSTFMRNILHNDNMVQLKSDMFGKPKLERELKENDIVIFKYDAEDENNKSRAMVNDGTLENTNLVQAMMFDSEGQNRYRSFVDILYRVGMAVRINKEKGNRVVILLDALDSGLDINYCKKIKEFFRDTLMNDIRYEQIWVFVAANQFALIEDQACLDVNTGEIIYFKEYGEYEKFIERKADDECKRIKKTSSRKKSHKEFE